VIKERRGTILDSRTTSTWVLLGKELLSRFLSPWAHYSFFAYFLLGVIVFGALGVWFEYFDLFSTHKTVSNPEGLLRTALLATFPAILCPACMQVVWSDDTAKYLKTFAIVVMVIGIALAIVYARPVVKDATAINVYWWLTGISALMWWIANAYQKDLLDIDTDAPTGGDPSKPLAGNLSGIKH